jgi:hypothetical protein
VGRVITVAFNDARAIWADLCGLDAANLVDQDKARFARAFNRCLRRGWEWNWWPDLMLLEERYFRDLYTGVHTTGTEVYFPATRKYYLNLNGSVFEAPATLVSGAYVLNSRFWIECAFSFTGSDWAAGTNYLVATIVRNPANDRYYACHTAHTSQTSFDATKFGLLTEFVPYVGWEQTGKTALGSVREVWSDNPRIGRARRLDWQPDELGVRFVGESVPERVWIEFRQRCPAFAEGASTVPAFLQDFAVAGAVVAFLEGEGQLEKALANDTGRLWSHLYDEADKLATMFQSRPRRARVANV